MDQLKEYRINEYQTHGDGIFDRKDFKAIGQNVIIESGVLVFHPNNITIGDNIYIGHNTILKGYFKNEMSIGTDTWIGQFCFFHSAGGVRIGKGVGIGPCVKILTSYHDDKPGNAPIIQNSLKMEEVVIEDGCDIGIGAIILPGVRIGEGAIIGAGSVVTKNVEPMTIMAGNPARMLRRR